MKNLNTFFALIALCILASGSAFAQVSAPEDDSDKVNVKVKLESILEIEVTSGSEQLFTFNTMDLYTAGIGTGHESTIKVKSSVPWNLCLNSVSENINGFDGTSGFIPLNNLGYTVTTTGTGTSIIAAATPSNGPKKVEYSSTTTGVEVLSPVALDNNNVGNAEDNTFIFNWELGTHKESGDMNDLTLVQQMKNNIFTIGNYQVDVLMTVSAHSFITAD